MKKYFLLISALVMTLGALASPLTPEQALRRVTETKAVKKFMKGDAGSSRLVMSGMTSKGSAAYYIFTEKTGTLFVAADDAVDPLLGYSDSGEFDPNNMPPQLKWWLKMYSDEIEFATREKGKRTPTLKPQKTTVADSKTAIAPMLKTQWDQTEPYNKYCPKYQGELTVTGCVATSTAQVMNYFEWPETTVNSISYKWNNTTLTSPAVKFQWNQMLDSYDGNYTTTQADAVARLMQVVGYAVNMQYDTSSNGGSGAYSSDIRTALVEKFGYDVGANYLYRDFFTAEEWDNMIYDNLLNVGPIVYGGDGSAGGHSFVCDGYDGYGAYHFNWGWGGVADGYFRLSALDPDVLGTGGGDGAFNYDQDAVLGIRKPVAGSTAPNPILACTTSVSGTAYWNYLMIGATKDGGYYNFGTESATFIYGVELKNVETGASAFLSSGDENKLDPYYGSTEYSIEVPESFADGTYTVRPAYKVNSSDWQYVKFYEGNTDSFMISLSAGNITILDDNNEGEVYISSWNCPEKLVAGENYSFSVTVRNTYDSSVGYSLDAYLCSEDEYYFNIEEELGFNYVNVPAQGKATMTFSGTLNKNLAPGDYYIVLAQDGEVVEYDAVTVISSSDSKVIYSGLTASCDWTFENIVLPSELSYIWKWDGQYLKGSGYVKKAYAAEGWAISPEIDLTGVSEANVNFEHAGKFQTTMRELCGFYVREIGGEWTKLNIANWPEAGTWNFVEAGEMSLNDFVGKKIQLGAKYGSSIAGADTWELKNVEVRGSGEPVVNPDPVVPTPGEDVTLDINDAENIFGEFYETSYNSNGGIQSYAKYQPLYGFNIKGYEFYFDKEDDRATDPALYMDIDGIIPQTLRMYKSGMMLVEFPAGTEVSTFTWNFKSVQGLDYVNVDSGDINLNVSQKKLVWTNTEGASSVIFIIPNEKGSDDKNPNMQITSFDVTTGNGEINPDPIDPTPEHYLYTGLVDDCDWTFENVVLPEELSYIWKWDGKYLKGSGYVKQAYAAEAWAISPVIDLSKAAAPSVNFDHAAKFQTTIRDLGGFYVREVGGEWTKLYIAHWPEAGTWDFTEAGEMSLRDFAGKKIQLGAKYGSSLAGADTWELKNVIVKDALTGVADVESDCGEAIYFDLMGRRVVKPINGIYIKVNQGKTSKVLVK